MVDVAVNESMWKMKTNRVHLSSNGEGKVKGRGSRPSTQTLMVLCARSAGRCQFKGCNKLLFRDSVSLTTFNNTNVAHIIASSPNGARGDGVKSHKLSDCIDNLMLMCPEHHKLIDDCPSDYPVEKLREMKQEQERMVESVCEALNTDQSQILLVTSKIKNRQSVTISTRDAINAILPDYCPIGQTLRIDVESGHLYGDACYWRDIESLLVNQFNCYVASAVRLNLKIHFSVFPLGPIPLIMKLGYLMGDKIHAEVYQHCRNPDTWRWQTTKESYSSFIGRCHSSRRKAGGVALVFSLSAMINEDEREKFADHVMAKHVYELCADKPSVDCITTKEELSRFWHTYQQLIEHIRADHPTIKEVAVFSAMPVSAAFEVGRRYMPGVYPRLRVYDRDCCYCEALTIGGSDEQ